jgi:SAM-dependent methyltransferase
MSSYVERSAREAEIWDHQALQRERYEAMLAHANEGPARARRDQFVAQAVADLNGKSVLEIGTQAWGGMLNKHGVRPASVICINISSTETETGRKQAELMGFPADFRVMDAHKLDFPDNKFDFAYGVAILHHLDLETAVQELFRVVKPGGRILFVEPLRLNPVAQLVRLLTPKARTADERPLGPAELRIIERYFQCDYLFSELFHVAAAVLSRFLFKKPVNGLTRTADRLDKSLASAFPKLGALYRSVTILGHKL